MAEERQPGFFKQLLAKRQEWAKQQPSLGAELRAITREAIKDVRETMNQVFFGQRDGPGEPGTPMNPTPQMVTQDLGTAKFANAQDMGAANFQNLMDQYAARGNVHGREQQKGKGMER
jgi:hypothetical protein